MGGLLKKHKDNKVLYGYMSSNFWLLWVESRGFPQAKKERSTCKAEQILKMTTIFAQKDNLGLRICSFESADLRCLYREVLSVYIKSVPLNFVVNTKFNGTYVICTFQSVYDF